YGVPIPAFYKIVRVPPTSAVPVAPDYLEGVINLRGKIVSVVDLRKRFGQPATELDRRSRILVVEHRGRLARVGVASGTAGGYDCGFGFGGSEHSGEHAEAGPRHDAGRRVGLCDRSRQI